MNQLKDIINNVLKESQIDDFFGNMHNKALKTQKKRKKREVNTDAVSYKIKSIFNLLQSLFTEKGKGVSDENVRVVKSFLRTFYDTGKLAAGGADFVKRSLPMHEEVEKALGELTVLMKNILWKINNQGHDAQALELISYDLKDMDKTIVDACKQLEATGLLRQRNRFMSGSADGKTVSFRDVIRKMINLGHNGYFSSLVAEINEIVDDPTKSITYKDKKVMNLEENNRLIQLNETKLRKIIRESLKSMLSEITDAQSGGAFAKASALLHKLKQMKYNGETVYTNSAGAQMPIDKAIQKLQRQTQTFNTDFNQRLQKKFGKDANMWITDSSYEYGDSSPREMKNGLFGAQDSIDLKTPEGWYKYGQFEPTGYVSPKKSQEYKDIYDAMSHEYLKNRGYYDDYEQALNNDVDYHTAMNQYETDYDDYVNKEKENRQAWNKYVKMNPIKRAFAKKPDEFTEKAPKIPKQPKTKSFAQGKTSQDRMMNAKTRKANYDLKRKEMEKAQEKFK